MFAVTWRNSDYIYIQLWIRSNIAKRCVCFKAVVGSVKSNNNHYDRIIKLYYVRLVREKQTNTTENSTQYQAITSLKAMLAILVYISMSDNSIE